jgi:hypothetical protein
MGHSSGSMKLEGHLARYFYRSLYHMHQYHPWVSQLLSGGLLDSLDQALHK